MRSKGTAPFKPAKSIDTIVTRQSLPIGGLLIAVAAPKFADGLRKRPRGISRKVRRTLALKVYTQLRCDGNREVVYLMHKGVEKLFPACGGADKHCRTLPLRIGECESAVVVAFHHEGDRLSDDTACRTAVIKAGYNAVYVVTLLSKVEVHHPAANLENTVPHTK